MDIRLIAVPYDSGIRGWRMGAGPERLLAAGLEDGLRAAGHAVSAERIELESQAAPEIRATFALAARLSERVAAARAAGALPIVLAGNCASALGTLAGLADDEPAVVWLDAHGDFNTPETTRSGMLDGMALAVATGRAWPAMAAALPGFRPVPDVRVWMVGTRDTDAREAELLAASGVPLIAPRYDADRLSAALDSLRARTGTVYLHIDLDVLDPSEGMANAFSAPDGLRVDDVLDLMRILRSRLRIGAAALTAYDPSYDADGRVEAAALRITAAVAQNA